MAKLNRTVQCAKYPWKKSVNPRDIPDGYCELKHQNLENTIAKDPISSIKFTRAMACHHSEIGDEQFCVGWLHNQLGVGNNIGLRIEMLKYDNAREIKIVGEQHDTFEDTLPKD